MIEFNDFSFRYREGTEPVLKDVSLTIPDGSFVGVTGAAGSGKSTLTYAVNGIVPHFYPGDFFGAVTVEGMDTVEHSLTDISRVVGSVCQDIDSQMVAIMVEDEMLYGLENFGVPHEEIPSRIDGALREIGIENLRGRVIASLSGGQKQKVAVASILAMRPKVLVLDEPTSELDPASSLNVFTVLKRYARERGATVIVVEQKIALVSAFSDMLVVLQDGRIRFADEPRKVLEHADELMEIGVACPRATSLMAALRARGLYGGSARLGVAEAKEALLEVLQ